MKTLLCTLILATLGTAVAKADEISISFDQPTQSVTPGETIQFFGTITNLTDTTIYLNADSLNLDGLSLTTTDQFLNTVPIDLAPGASSGDIELFDVTVSDPLLDAAGIYSGTYDLIGGADGGTDTAQDALVNTPVTFSVDTVASVATVPEPSSIYLLLGGISALAPLARKMRTRA